ncbi:MAG: hypothetical protein IPI21_17910 [Propionivibrio sp.]|nr:hypothetical protein [Propionivibrio sp.]
MHNRPYGKLSIADYEPPPRPIHLLYPQSRLLPARTRALINWLKSEIGPIRFDGKFGEEERSAAILNKTQDQGVTSVFPNRQITRGQPVGA